MTSAAASAVRLGFQWAGLSKPVLFCDIEPWSRKVLAKHWPDVPIAEDVKELASDPNRNVPDCDILTGGYPCQPFSLAGKRLGLADRPPHLAVHLANCCTKTTRLVLFRVTFMVTSAWASTKCFLTWKAKGTPAGRLLFQLAVSMRPTEETESGLLHTPTATANQMAPSMVAKNSGWMLATPAAADSVGTTGGGQGKSLRTDVKMFPTPTANEDAAGTPDGKMQRMLGNHPAIRGTTPEEWKAGSLNPAWVEWLMGYPSGWTDLED